MNETELRDSKLDRRTQLLIYCFAVFALLSVGQGFLTSLKPGQSQDLETVRIWVSTWLWQGSNPYLLPSGLTANYPPHAITFLSPLALIPQGWVVVVQKGSHAQLKHPSRGGRVTVPLHAGETIGPGLLRSILSQAGVTVEELRAVL